MDKQSFITGVKAAERSLYRIARSYLPTDMDAADAVQEALTRGWAKLGTLQQPEYFKTWLTRILINVCKSALRRRPRVESVETMPEPAAPGEPADHIALREALHVLDVKYRVPLVLHHLDGYSVKEIAGLLLLPQGTVKNRLYRAREKMKAMLQKEVFDDGAH